MWANHWMSGNCGGVVEQGAVEEGTEGCLVAGIHAVRREGNLAKEPKGERGLQLGRKP